MAEEGAGVPEQQVAKGSLRLGYPVLGSPEPPESCCDLIHLAVGQNQWYHFGVGVLVYFSWDWDVHWGYDFDFDPWPDDHALRLCEAGLAGLHSWPAAGLLRGPGHLGRSSLIAAYFGLSLKRWLDPVLELGQGYVWANSIHLAQKLHSRDSSATRLTRKAPRR